MIRRLSSLLLAGVLGGCAVAGAAVLPRAVLRTTRQIRIEYVAHDGVLRAAYSPAAEVVLADKGSAASARHLTARPWRRRARERTGVG